MKVAAMADANGIVMSPHGQQQIHVHQDCAVPNVNFAEFYPATVRCESIRSI